MFRRSFALCARQQHQQQKLGWYQQQKQNAGYWWAEKKKEVFFAIVAMFALGQVAYRELVYSGIVKRETQQSNKPIAPINIRKGPRD